MKRFLDRIRNLFKIKKSDRVKIVQKKNIRIFSFKNKDENIINIYKNK